MKSAIPLKTPTAVLAIKKMNLRKAFCDDKRHGKNDNLRKTVAVYKIRKT